MTCSLAFRVAAPFAATGAVDAASLGSVCEGRSRVRIQGFDVSDLSGPEFLVGILPQSAPHLVKASGFKPE